MCWPVANMARMSIRPPFLALAVILSLVSFSPAFSASDRTPKATVEGYLSAMKEHRFPDGYDFVSSTLRGGKDRETWAKEQQYIVQMGEVKIFGFQVFDAASVTDDRAKVPNILKSQDKFLNQLGLDEYELYELIKEEGEWRIDQQTLIEGSDRSEYFPEE